MRVLCLGNNTEDTDRRARKLAQERGMICHGLLSELHGYLTTQQYQEPGVYHTSVYDLAQGRLVEIMDQFDNIIVLDQPKNAWSHPDAYLMTVRAAKLTCRPVEYLDSAATKSSDFFERLVDNNKSFCIFPFIELLVYSDWTTVCCRSRKPITKIRDIGDWQTNVAYREIRQKMIAGESVWDHCGFCYRLEEKGIRSARQQETVEWANRLDLYSLDDLNKITSPAYFEVRASNKCNLQCRTCVPEASHLIDKEYRDIGLTKQVPVISYDHGFDIVDFTNLKKLYVAGGEPLVMHEFYQFLDHCINQGQTDFEMLINTNGTKLSQRFREQIKNFRNLQFMFSLDALGDLNHYIRWPSEWQTIVDNLSYLRDHGHKCAVNTTVSIYNVARLYELFDYLDHQFPNILIHVGLAEYPVATSLWLYPDHERVIDGLKRIETLPCYQNDKLFASTIDGMLQQFVSRSKTPNLSAFFDFNDRLDRSRSISLADYIPELEQWRSKQLTT